jgi:hypothetical protein
MGSVPRRLLREPLLHFLVAGVVLFAAYAALSPGADEGTSRSRRIVRVTAREVDWLEKTWARQWQRPPDDQELAGLVTDYLREELLAHEATELGLADDDTVVRRRLAQKMEFIVRDTAAAAEPPEDELRRLYEANRGRFEVPGRISFTHVPFTRDGDVARRVQEALEALSRANAPADSAELGDRSLLERQILEEDQTGVAGMFGTAFAHEVFALDPGEWRGPIESAYGLHLVRVTEKHATRPREFAEVRGAVLEEWRRRHQQAESEKYFSSLLEKYEVVVDERVKPLLGPLSIARARDAAP